MPAENTLEWADTTIDGCSAACLYKMRTCSGQECCSTQINLCTMHLHIKPQKALFQNSMSRPGSVAAVSVTVAPREELLLPTRVAAGNKPQRPPRRNVCASCGAICSCSTFSLVCRKQKSGALLRLAKTTSAVSIRAHGRRGWQLAAVTTPNLLSASPGTGGSNAF